MHRLLLLALAIPLAGCVSAAKTIVTAPFKVAGAAWDAATTSQEEADRNRGRAARKDEEEQRKADRRAARDAREAEEEARDDERRRERRRRDD